MQASLDGIPVRLVSTPSVSQRLFEASPLKPFGSLGGAGEEVFFGGEDAAAIFFFCCPP